MMKMMKSILVSIKMNMQNWAKLSGNFKMKFKTKFSAIVTVVLGTLLSGAFSVASESDNSAAKLACLVTLKLPSQPNGVSEGSVVGFNEGWVLGDRKDHSIFYFVTKNGNVSSLQLPQNSTNSMKKWRIVTANPPTSNEVSNHMSLILDVEKKSHGNLSFKSDHWSQNSSENHIQSPQPPRGTLLTELKKSQIKNQKKKSEILGNLFQSIEIPLNGDFAKTNKGKNAEQKKDEVKKDDQIKNCQQLFKATNRETNRARINQNSIHTLEKSHGAN
jgi:hypothetical protein